MNEATHESVGDLIARILARYHEGHRRDLPCLVRLASDLGDGVAASELAARLERLHPELELHMFMEEMRLFPMMTQGGHVLLEQLIEDMSAEHTRHASRVDRLRALVDEACRDPVHAVARWRFHQFLDEFEAHIALEEEALFPRFIASVHS